MVQGLKLLFVASGNKSKSITTLPILPIIEDLHNEFIKNGVEISYFYIKGNGILGYLKNYPRLMMEIYKTNPNLIFAYYGLSGLLACLNFRCPVVVSFIGEDINQKKLRFFSRIAMKLAKHSIFVSVPLSITAKAKRDFSIIPYGVDLNNTFNSLDKHDCRIKLGLNPDKNYVLFSSSFTNPVKNYPLASTAISKIPNTEIIELIKNIPRKEMQYYFNAVDLLLLTSFSEGSSQVIKEAMACNCPIVSTHVGDAKWVIGNTPGCFITTFEPEDVTEKIKSAMEFAHKNGKTTGRIRILQLGLDIESTSKKLIEVFGNVVS